MLGVPESQVSQRLFVPKQRGEWIAPGRGLWVPVPPEFRGWGGPPASEFLAALMSHLEVSYYIGWLAAAAVHGAAHQAPQVTHVAVSRLVRDRRIGRADLRFHIRGSIDALPTVMRMARSGPLTVSSPEVTALDLASDLVLAGGLNNATTVITDLVDEAGLDDSVLADLAPSFGDAAIRRTGWIIETYTTQRLERLAEYVKQGSANAARLHPGYPLSGCLNERWRLRLNTAVEMD